MVGKGYWTFQQGVGVSQRCRKGDSCSVYVNDHRDESHADHVQDNHSAAHQQSSLLGVAAGDVAMIAVPQGW